MKKVILIILSVFILYWTVVASSQIDDMQINLDIVTSELEYDYQMEVFEPSSTGSKAYIRILERLRAIPDEKLISFYPKLIKFAQSRKFSDQNEQVLNIVEYMTVLELITREHINKTYTDSQNNWATYKNNELGFELVYRKNHWNWNKRIILKKDNLIYIPGEHEVTDDFIKSFDTKTSYELLRWEKNIFLVKYNIESNDDISNVLAKIYGKWCWVFKEYPTDKDDVVRIYVDKIKSQKNGCEHYVMDSAEYNKKQKKLVLWNLGYSFGYFKTEVEADLFYRSKKFINN